MCLTAPVYAQLTPEHVADKIVTHGYNLIDAYIKELSEPTTIFPNGTFRFILDNDVQVVISPAGIGYEESLKVWRSISFSSPDGSASSVILDGPISGEPGEPNLEAIAEAKNTLSDYLLESNMIIKEVFKEGHPQYWTELDLSLEDDGQIFIDLMYDSIKLSTPLRTGPEPSQATIPKGTIVKVNPQEDKKPINIAGNSTSLRQVKTKVDFAVAGEKEIKIEVDEVKKESKIEIDNKIVITKKGIEIKESKLYIKTTVGLKEIKVLPEEAISKAKEITTIEEIILEEESQKLVYSVKGTKSAKLFFLIPVKIEIEKKINAETGDVISVKKPWWSFLAL